VVLGVNAQGRGLERLDAGAIRHARTAHGDLGIEVIMAGALAGQRSVGLQGMATSSKRLFWRFVAASGDKVRRAVCDPR
jgi:hypothetical protein